MRPLGLALLVGLLLLGGGIWLFHESSPPPAESSEPIRGFARVSQDGVSMEIEVAEGRFELRVADETGRPAPTSRPWVWLDRGSSPLDEGECRARIKSLRRGSLMDRASFDLNRWVVLTRNDDNTVSIINPTIGLKRTKLEASVSLSGRSEDWAISKNEKWLVLTLPEKNLISFVDLGRYRLAGSLEVGLRPGRVVFAPDGSSIWVANEGEGSVSVIDPETRTLLSHLEIGKGESGIAFLDETAWIVSKQGRKLLGFDVQEFDPVASIPIGEGATSLLASKFSKALYVSLVGGKIVVIDSSSQEVVKTLEIDSGKTVLEEDPSGRWLIAATRESGRVEIFDTSSLTSRHSFRLGQPDAISFSKDYTYVRDAANGGWTLLETDSLLRDAEPPLVEVAVGQRPTSPTARGGVISQTPLPGVMAMIHEATRSIYLYGEGMMAPSASHPNYGRSPVAIRTLDRSLREVESGTWVTHAAVPPGEYQAIVIVDSPRTSVCLQVKIHGPSEPEEVAPKFVLSSIHEEQLELSLGETHTLSFELEDAEGRGPAPDEVSSLIYRLPGTHQWRPTIEARGGARFSVDFTPHLPGRYRLLVGVPGQGVELGDLAPIEFLISGLPEEPKGELQ